MSVIDIVDFLKVWRTAQVKCDYCKAEWTAVYHKESNCLQCKYCLKLNNVDKMEIK